MVRYFGMLILSISIMVISIGYLCYIFIKKWKMGKRFPIPLKETAGALFSLLIFSFLFVIYVPDLPDVLSQQPTIYKGKCDIHIYSGKGAHLEANFEQHSIWFSLNDYDKARAGSYYCVVEYYPHSDEGHSLILYQSKDGKEVETK